MDPISIFQPVVERESPRAFISKHPRNETNGLAIPLLIGILTDEGAGKAAGIKRIIILVPNSYFPSSCV